MSIVSTAQSKIRKKEMEICGVGSGWYDLNVSHYFAPLCTDSAEVPQENCPRLMENHYGHIPPAQPIFTKLGYPGAGKA